MEDMKSGSEKEEKCCQEKERRKMLPRERKDSWKRNEKWVTLSGERQAIKKKTLPNHLSLSLFLLYSNNSRHFVALEERILSYIMYWTKRDHFTSSFFLPFKLFPRLSFILPSSLSYSLSLPGHEFCLKVSWKTRREREEETTWLDGEPSRTGIFSPPPLSSLFFFPSFQPSFPKWLFLGAPVTNINAHLWKYTQPGPVSPFLMSLARDEKKGKRDGREAC